MMYFKILRLLLYIVFMQFLIFNVKSSHFRGGSIMWKPTRTQNEVEITFRISWRRSYGSTLRCTNEAILSKAKMGQGTESMECFAGCKHSQIGEMTFVCTDFSTIEDWSSGVNTLYFNFTGAHDHLYQFGYAGSAWIAGIRGASSGNWEVRAEAHLYVRNDTGKINSSPRTTMQPITRMQYGCHHILSIPVTDIDGDHVRCRWAEGKRRECGGICGILKNATLNQRECEIQYLAVQGTGWFAVAVQIEDFSTTASTEALSSVPLQFLIQVFMSDAPCSQKPKFIEPTFVDGSCIAVPFNSTFFNQIFVRSSNKNVSIAEIQATSPGIIVSDLLQLNTIDWYANVTWTPSADMEGPFLFCYTALDSTGMTSDKNCITLLVGASPPEIIHVYPRGDIFPQHNTWIITFNSLVVRPTRTTYIKFVNSLTGRIAQQIDLSTTHKDITYPQGILERNITTTITVPLLEKLYYYVTVDSGAGLAETKVCRAESVAIRDQSFWNFRIRDITPPVITPLSSPSVSRGNISVEWRYDEDVISKCVVVGPNITLKVLCNGSMSVLNLKDGLYTMFVYATDLEGNEADTWHHNFRIDHTPPVMTVEPIPERINNSREFEFRFNEISTAFCSLEKLGHSSIFHKCGEGLEITYKPYDLMDNTSYTLAVKGIDGVGNECNVSLHVFTTDFTRPTIFPLPDQNVICGDDFSVNATGIPNVTDTSGDVSLHFVDDTKHFCGIQRTWIAVDDAENEVKMYQKINFQYPKYPKLLFTKEREVACGDIDQFTLDMEDYFHDQLKHPCGMKFRNITFEDSRNPSECDITFERTWIVSDGCGMTINGTQQIKVLELESPTFPTQSQTRVNLSPTLRWIPYPGATTYSLYLWLFSNKRPEHYFASNIISASYDLNNLKPNTKYYWQLDIHMNSNKSIPGPRWAFETLQVVDLIVEDIFIPNVAFSGQKFVVRWSVRNIGSATTQRTSWYDKIYYSYSDNLVDRDWKRFFKRQQQILYPNDGYTSELSVSLREEDIGFIRIFVETSYRDFNTSNNIQMSDSRIDVHLTPPPDLVIDDIRVLGGQTFFSGSEITVLYSVRNNGDGPTTANYWIDKIYWSQDGLTYQGTLGSYYRFGRLIPDESYDVKKVVNIPRKIFGNFSIIVWTDRSSHVFENYDDDNNRKALENLDIVLTPPPDLVVTSIQAEGYISTGDDMTVRWTVANDGFRAPYVKYWIDKVELVSTQQPSTSILLGQKSFYGIFERGETYSRTLTTSLSSDIATGLYTIKVQVDYRNDVFEYLNTENNILIKNITIEQLLPDLEVYNITVTLNSTSWENIVNICWYVKNEGQGRTLEDSWIDKLTISYNQNKHNFQLEADWLYDHSHQQMRSNETYKVRQEINLPPQVYGTVAFKVLTDAFHRTAEKNRINNLKSSEYLSIPLLAPDLFISEFYVKTPVVYSGNEIDIECNVGNAGSNMKSNQQWIQSLILSETKTNLSPMVNESVVLTWNDTNVANMSVTLSMVVPRTIHGDYFLHCFADTQGYLFEGTENLRLQNNVRSIRISVLKPPSPDLLVVSVKSLFVREEKDYAVLSITWTVTNRGNSMPEVKTWTDAIGMSPELHSEWGSLFDKLSIIKSVPVTNRLETGGSYTFSETVVMPYTSIGTYYLYVITDYENDIDEFDSENNNFLYSSRSIFIPPQKVPKLDLHVTHLSVSEKVIPPGGKIRIHYIVKNMGDLRTHVSSWKDLVYIFNTHDASKQSVFETGILISSRIHTSALDTRDWYATNETVNLPTWIKGEFYLYFLSISNVQETAIFDTDYQTSFSFPDQDPVVIDTTNLPNLYVVANVESKIIKSGQPYKIFLNITNVGSMRTSNKFLSSFHLSDDFDLDPFDIKLKEKYNHEFLHQRQSIYDQVFVFIPFDLKSKNYFVIINVDSGDDIVENDESDNLFVLPISIEEVFSNDVAVVDVEATKNVKHGDDFIVSWKLRNNGSTEIEGYKCDSVFLSIDNNFDIDDQWIGSPACGFVSINPYHTYGTQSDLSFQKTEVTPTVNDASYFTIVKSRCNVPDYNLENNIGISNEITKVSIDILRLDSSFTVQFENARSTELLMVPNVTSDETLVIRTSSGTKSYYFIKVKYGSVATDTDFDVVSSNPFQMNKTLTIPNTKSGSYYIALSMIDVSNDVRNITVSARIAKFEIINVAPTIVSTLGNTSIRIEGTEYPDEIDIHLYNDLHSEFRPVQIIILSSTVLYATFDFRNCSEGNTYSIIMKDKESSNDTRFFNAVMVVSGEVGRLSTKIESSEALLPGQTGRINIFVKNAGLTDLVAPLLFINTSGPAEMKYPQDDTEKTDSYSYSSILIGSSKNTLGGILPPGTFERYDLELKQIDGLRTGQSNIRVSLIPSDKRPHFYLFFKDELRPKGVGIEAWNLIWENFLSIVGLSWESLYWRVSSIMNQLSAAERQVHELQKIVSLLLDLAEGHNENTLLVDEADLIGNKCRKSHVVLEFKRLYTSKISSRFRESAMGIGWLLPLWETEIATETDRKIIFKFDGRKYDFTGTEQGLYSNEYLGQIHQLYTTDCILYNLTFVYHNNQQALSYVYSASDGKLLCIISLQDSSFVRIYYNKRQISRIHHSEGPYIDVSYNSRGLIERIELQNDTGSDQDVTFNYELSRNLLVSTQDKFGITYFEYDKSNSLVKVTYPSKEKIHFTFSDEGWLSAWKLTRNETIIARKKFKFTGEPQVRITTYPDDINLTIIYDENGDVALRRRKHFPVEKIVRTFNKKTVYQGDTKISEEVHDPNSKTVTYTDANGDFLIMSYDSKGRLNLIKDVENYEYTLTYNEQGRISLVTYPDNSSEIHNYSSVVDEFTTRSGHTVITQINEYKNPVLKSTGDAIVSFSYDHNQQLEEVESNTGRTSFKYDERGLPSYVKFGHFVKERQLNYTFNDNFQKTGISLSEESYDVTYEYNSRNLLSKVINRYDDEVLLTAEYNSKDQLTRKVLGNGAFTLYDYYDSTGLLKGIYNHYPDKRLNSKFEYKYDRRKRKITLHTLEGDWKFRYDLSGQLTYFKRPNGSEEIYEYDKRKNRKVNIRDGERKEYNVDSLNQYTVFNNNEQTFIHDKNGNLKKKNGKSKTEFQFNSENMLIGYTTPNKKCKHYYDGLKNIIRKSCSDRDVTYVVDMYGPYGYDILAEIPYNDTSTQTVYYFYGGDQLGLIAQQNSDGYYYYQFDPIGSVVSILDKAGNLANSYTYDPFGKSDLGMENIPNTFKFVGQWGVVCLDSNREFYIMRARVYDSEHGRFLSMDRSTLDGKLKNFYAYSYNNPVHFIDPKGDFPVFLIPMAYGAIVNVASYAAINYLTGEEITLGGAATAMAVGALSGGPISSIASKLLPKVKYAKEAISFIVDVGANALNDAFDGKPFRPLENVRSAAEGKLLSKLTSPLKPLMRKTGSKLSDLLRKNFGNFYRKINKPKYRKYSKQYKDFVDEHGLRPGEDLTGNIGEGIIQDWMKDLAKNAREAVIAWIASHDPNDITGPVGYGAARFIPKDTVMFYKIRFENYANASAPAQKVLIEHVFDKNVDIRAFQMQQIGFHTYIKDLLGTSFVQIMVDITEMYPGLQVRIRGGLDIVNNKMTLDFQTVESVTGLSPTDPRRGFLPPNNGTTGQGFVSFSVTLKDEVETLSKVNAKASIYFDENEPIDTPDFFNTVDDSPPEINLTVIEEAFDSGSLGISVTSRDVGSGFQSTDVMIKKDFGFDQLISSITENVFSINLESGMKHELLFLPTDYTGNRPSIDNAVSSNLLVVYIPEKTGSCKNLNNCSENGNCTKNNICICFPGYFGPACNQENVPLEPPILMIKAAEGSEDNHVNISLFATTVNGEQYDSLTIYIRDIPEGLTFTTGKSSGNDWEIPKIDFGEMFLIPPKDFAGNFTLDIEAVLTKGHVNSSRSSNVNIQIVPVVDGVTYDIEASCYNTKMNYAYLLIRLSHNDVDKSEKINAIIHVPREFHLKKGISNGNGYYYLTENDTKSSIQITSEKNFDIATIQIEIQLVASENGLQDEKFKTTNVTVHKCADESMFSYRVELRLELDIELNLLDTKTPEYTTLFQSILKALKDFYSTSTQTEKILTDVHLISIRKGSIVAVHDVVLRENEKEKITEALSSLIEERQTINIGNKTIKALSFNFPKDEIADSQYRFSKTIIIVIISASSLLFIIVVIIVICVKKRNMTRKGSLDNELPINFDKAVRSSTTVNNRGYSPIFLYED